MARGIETHNGKVSLKDIVEQQIAIDLGMDKTITDRVNPLRVTVDSTSNWYPDDHASTIDNDMYVGWLMAQVGEKPTGSSTILRLESNTKGITLDSVIDIPVSGVPQGNFSYFMKLNPATNVDAWNAIGTCQNAGGFLKIKVGGYDKWIQLYQTAPA